jgi:mannose-6-phosphate isomerase-like protein (cupin superfamily)
MLFPSRGFGSEEAACCGRSHSLRCPLTTIKASCGPPARDEKLEVADIGCLNPRGVERMKGFVDDIEKLTEENDDFRRVLYTGKNLQLVLMTIRPGEEIGEEVHDDRDQFFRVEAGTGEIVIDGAVSKVESDMAMIVPAGAHHNVKCTGKEPLKLYTLYAPPEHRHGTVHPTKADADASDEHFDGVTSE